MPVLLEPKMHRAPTNAPVRLPLSLAQMTGLLVEATSPKRLYLFGSRARGDWRHNSDWDFYVVVDDCDSERLDLLTEEAFVSLSEAGVPKDIIVSCETYFNDRAGVLTTVEHQVIDEGVLLYGRPDEDR